MWLTWTHRAALARHRHRIITNGETFLLLTGHHSVVTEAGHTGVGVQGELRPVHELAPIESTTCQINGRKLIIHLLLIGFILILVFLWMREVYNTYWYYHVEKCTAKNVSERLYLLFLPYNIDILSLSNRDIHVYYIPGYEDDSKFIVPNKTSTICRSEAIKGKSCCWGGQ